MAWRAHGRFPFNYFVWVELGEMLVAQHRIAAAETVLTEAIRRFPDEAPPISAYAELLLKTGQPAAAVALLRPATERFSAFGDIPRNAANLWSGLTAALLSSGDILGAKEVATQASELLVDDKWASKMPAGFEDFRRERARRDAQPADTSPPVEGATLFAGLSEARIFRQRARDTETTGPLVEAAALIENHRAQGALNPAFAAESALLLVDRGNPEQALRELADSGLVHTVDPSIAVAAARAKRAMLLRNSEETDVERRYSPSAFDELTSEIRGATLANPAMRPLGLLVCTQLAATMVDGAVLDGERQRLYGALTAWTAELSRHGVDDGKAQSDEELGFAAQWADSIRELTVDVGPSR